LWLIAGFASPGIILFISTLLNITALDPKLGDSAYRAKYMLEGRYERAPGGSAAESVEIETSGAGGEKMSLLMKGYGAPRETALAPDGTVMPDVYSIFWVHLTNPIAVAGAQSKNWELRARDDLGLLGDPGKIYTVKSTERFIWWDYVLSSQASFRAGIYDGGRRVGSAIYDATCGMLFELVPHTEGWGRMYLVHTDFPISRNRYVLLYVAIAFSAVILLWFAAQHAKSAPETKFKTLDNLWYAAAIALTVLVDYIYDTWFFGVGDTYTYIIHIAAILIFLYRFRLWTIPMILEMAWVAAYTWPTSGKLAPGVVYFPSMLVTTAMMIMFRKTPRPVGTELKKT
jgi:hypothetical protein